MKLLLAIHSKLSCGWRVCVHFSDRVPSMDEDVVKGNLLTGKEVHMSKLILYKKKSLIEHNYIQIGLLVQLFVLH